MNSPNWKQAAYDTAHLARDQFRSQDPEVVRISIELALEMSISFTRYVPGFDTKKYLDFITRPASPLTTAREAALNGDGNPGWVDFLCDHGHARHAEGDDAPTPEPFYDQPASEVDTRYDALLEEHGIPAE